MQQTYKSQRPAAYAQVNPYPVPSSHPADPYNPNDQYQHLRRASQIPIYHPPAGGGAAAAADALHGPATQLHIQECAHQNKALPPSPCCPRLLLVEQPRDLLVALFIY